MLPAAAGPWFTEGGVAARGVLSSAAVDVSIEMSSVDLKLDPPLTVNNTKQATVRKSQLTAAALYPALTQRKVASATAILGKPA
jgi:hypothetical protein